jgi:Uncharacterized distant relative of homeotic protein bithoraxoid
MQTIREFTTALRRRPGVEAVIVSGRDGLLIEGAVGDALDLQDLAARVPSFVTEAAGLGDASRLGDFVTGILEHDKGYAIISSIGNDALLTVLTSKSVELGSLLFDVRSQRSSIGSLV